ncbi:unnamed protein product [Hydatigera taeniaeformis]|uniref:DDE Tnp4 domain-containing protein n=1 Tax=Hydatigena taeniaeformis TaxID=6205 RepID=A0A0R3XBD2_HYDTA|nr:unnamed protein product [Hydatigera taeniaeformis]
MPSNFVCKSTYRSLKIDNDKAIAVVLLVKILYNMGVNGPFRMWDEFRPLKHPTNLTDLYPYHHVVEQLEWIIAYAANKSHFPSTNPPRIYYDRKYLYHSTTSDGCRYKCIFINTTHNLSRGDVAVFSSHFDVAASVDLKNRGVLVAFETGESPHHAPRLSSAQLGQVSAACSNAKAVVSCASNHFTVMEG